MQKLCPSKSYRIDLTLIYIYCSNVQYFENFIGPTLHDFEESTSSRF